MPVHQRKSLWVVFPQTRLAIACHWTKQGCPLSPLLFNLSIDPLAQFIHQNDIFTPITIGSSQHHISLYANDALIYLSDIQSSLPVILNTLNNFGKISGFKINFRKSVLMLFNVDENEITIPSDITSDYINSIFHSQG